MILPDMLKNAPMFKNIGRAQKVSDITDMCMENVEIEAVCHWDGCFQSAGHREVVLECLYGTSTFSATRRL